MASFARSPLPPLTTSLPPRGSSSSSSSPLTPFSELGAESSSISNSITTPTTASDVLKPSKNYITYPEPSLPPRQLTPPPKSRFVPLFESISRAANSPTNSSRRSSLGDDEASPAVTAVSLPFSPAVTKQMRKSLSLTSNYTSFEPALKSAPLTSSSLGGSPWSRSLQLPSTPADNYPDYLSHTEALNDVIRALRHQLNVKGHSLQTAEAEIARLSGAYSYLAEEKAKIVDNYARARKRIDELELILFSKREVGDVHRRSVSQPKSLGPREPKTSAWGSDVKKIIQDSFDSPNRDSQALDEETPVPLEPLTEKDYEMVRARIPEMPADVIIASLAAMFLAADFDFLKWIDTNGLQLPQSAKLLAPLTWEDRLRLDAGDLEKLGVSDPADRGFIMRVLKAIAEGEAPHLHPSLMDPGFTEEQYVTIMREQRIDKHVPNLSGLAWPLRLFVDEDDLTMLQVEKAGARGTIMTVFGGLRRGAPRPDPRPRRGTKKSKRAKQDSTSAAGDDNSPTTEKPPFVKQPAVKQPAAKQTVDKRGSNIKIAMGRQGPRMAPPRDKGAFAPAHSHLAGNSHPSWFGNRA